MMVTYFNPRSREGSDRKSVDDRLATIEISIHAPVKGATAHTLAGFGGAAISIHAPVKGATRGQRRRGTPCRDFNPRSREGSDSYHLAQRVYDKLFQSTLP